MSKYKIAKLISITNGLNSRKRVQKTVHLLQAAGCDFNLQFRIHHHGPYSAGLASHLDELTRSGVLLEHERAGPFGTQYDYRCADFATERFTTFEATERGAKEARDLSSFDALITKLKSTRPRVLELAATIVAMSHAGNALYEAIAETADFKQEPMESAQMLEACELAQEILSYAHGKARQDIS
jgi:uncharacterized protein YwgA